MRNFQDQWTRWHHKESDGINPPSHNGWIYSAYSKYLAPGTTEPQLLFECYRQCKRSLYPVKVDRSPNLIKPPLSKDEVIGLASLGLLTDNELRNSYYNFCNLDADFDRKLSLSNTIKAIKALFKIRKEHRNYAWQQNITETYPLLFKLPPWDIYYIKKLYKKRATLLEFILFYLNAASVILKGSGSIRLLLWLQLKDLNMNILAKLIKVDKALEHDFKKDHPFYKK